MRWLTVVLLLAGCGVPVPPSVADLQARAARGESRAAGELVELLGRDTPAEMRADAYRALLEVGTAYAEPILAACRDRDAVRREHALALTANLRLPGAREEAVRALGDAGFSRRYVAAWALGELGDPSDVAPLVGALGTADLELAKEVARSLVKLGKSVVPALLREAPRLGGAARGYALRTLGELQDPSALPVLVAALAEPSAREAAAWALGKLGDPRAEESLLPLLKDADWKVRLEASRSLGLLESRRAEAELDRLREGDPVPAVREWAARSLAILKGAPETYPNSRGERVLPDELYR